MNEVQTIKAKLQAALAEIEAFEAKQTKACSARIRKALGDVKNDVTAVRAALIAADKAGY